MQEISATKKSLSVFSLIRTKTDCYYPPLSVDFTPLKCFNHQDQRILPSFNQDGLFFTSAFVVPYENTRAKENATETIAKEREKFLRRVDACNSSNMDQKPVFNPRDDNYCSLCQTSFKCYWAHVNSKTHLRHIQTNKFNSYIHELCQKMSGKDEQPAEQAERWRSGYPKKKKISKGSKKGSQRKQAEMFKIQDFIIKLPSDLFSKEAQNINCNISTNNHSPEQNLTKN